jgi:tRNA pseudouridine55 synthase
MTRRRDSLLRLDGILVLDKPAGLSSNAALQRAKRLLGARKAGHGGTLDPLASGVLPLLFGEATKFAALALESDKTYRATLKLGETTATGDAEGELLERRPVSVDAAAVDAVLGRFRGTHPQTPPMYSALKRGGRPLYALAREGVSVPRAPREVRIERLERLAFRPPELVLRVVCSKGTYVRVLAEDIGAALGCGAHLGALRREAAGALTLDAAVTLDELEAIDPGERVRRLIPLESLLAGAPRVVLESERQAADFRHGKALQVNGLGAGRWAVFTAAARFLGVGDVVEPGILRPRRLLADTPESTQAAEIS